jgi:uncharacterized small protein (DUF1192 family)
MDASQQTSIDLSAGIYIKGLPLGENSFLAVTKFAQLQAIMRNPRDLQPSARRNRFEAEQLEEEASIHELIQRALTGAKKSNVPKYAQYIYEVVTGQAVGVLPPIHTWSPEKLTVVMNGPDTYLLVPQSDHLLAIDGETQLTGHFEVPRLAATPEEKKLHREYPLPMVVHHGINTETARQYFHDLNILAVKPNTSLGLSMDAKDTIMKVVGNLEVRIAVLNGKVDRLARQLPKKSHKIMTVQSLRQFAINTMLGMPGIQYGARPAPIPDGLNLNELEEVGRDWLEKYLSHFAAEVVDRENSLAGSAPVIAAVGAIGNTILKAGDQYERERVARDQLESLKEVNWKKGDHWAGIAGKFTAKGTFSIGGTKEVAYAIYNVLTDSANPGYRRVRTGGPASVLSDVAVAV